MLRIAKLTDYATVLMVRLAREPARCFSAAQLSDELGLPLPTVSKLLKRLLQAGLLTSMRGAGGGYSLAHAPHAVSVADVVSAIEGPVALTECSLGKGSCSLENNCATRANWQLISRAVRVALEAVSLADMALPRMQAIRMPGLQEKTR
ncbi:MAG: SUF system Fe-S cluster assembly regulator [Deltaproteobacteria bacterium]|nr:SUF system Fe-S cluster assembly regulator [Deltaproteobacteria bacterium]